MSKILKFETTTGIMKQQLTRATESLAELYDNHARVMEVLVKIEDIIDKEESDYDDLLDSYISKVGVENVEIRYLEFSTRGINYEAQNEEFDPEA